MKRTPESPAIGVSARQAFQRKAAIVTTVLAIHVLAVMGLLRAFDIEVVPQAVKSLVSFAVPAATPEPETAQRVEEVEPEGASGEEAAKATPRPTAAPPARIAKPELPIPVATGEGTESRSGAAGSGAGTGGGGPGLGTGSGGAGSGTGGVPYARRAEKIGGEIRAKDYPRASAEQRDGAYVIVHFTVGVDGRASGCRVARSSSNAEVDAITCRLVEKRFRYRPAIDANGDPVPELVGWKQWWWR